MSSNHPSSPEATTQAAHDTSTTPQEPQPTMSTPSPPTCAHSIPPTLALLLSQALTCPPCVIVRHIADLKDVQSVLRTRGGVFFSRGRPKSDKHRALMDRWRKGKVELLNLISMLEVQMGNFVARGDYDHEGWKDIHVAMSQWEQEKEVLAKVPGYVYEGEQVKLSEENSVLVDAMLDSLKNSILGLLIEDGPEVVVAEPGVTSDSGCSTSAPATSSTAISIAVPEQDSVPDAMDVEAETKLPIRSVLKRKSSHDTPSRSPKRTRIADMATVCPESLVISNPSPYIKLSTAPVEIYHSLSAFSDSRRRKSHFSRSSESYSPGLWASPAFCAKPNTSCFKLQWEEVEALWKEEEEEVAEEKRVHEKLRVIAEVYLMNWYVRSVASHVGLEKVVKIGQASAESNETASEGNDGVA